MMDSPITLSADNETELNRIIDKKLREGYLIMGGMQAGEQGKLNQIMVLPNNIDGEVTARSIVKLIIVIPVWAAILYFLI